ncbi:FAD-binding oxidoreductase [Sphaerisporangium rubeum]|uniref:Glycolate oxidase FAD binding subunit n=1 Tax=Sphaerisporangium rubeum TaxID=321317 RepID=A0A7X0II56_9ACTN|nr:FAD-binding oxidoreductase [Sphaerisporangium rubeum]MBB6475104.1 glycolate oxidase FAD binding subunit [Sphaerisporangium rubeum]
MNAGTELSGTGVAVRDAGPGDTVAGAEPRWVASPASTEEVAVVLRAAARRGLAVVPAGGRTKIGWGGPPERCDLLLDTRRLDQVLEHEAGDLVVRVQAGLPVRDLGEALAASGQELALDVPPGPATVGGVLATGAAGPRRLRYGTGRDLLIGITVVLADGTVARAGGRVVKNVAGYDLGKLFTGSLGTLGVITEATFRLRPLPSSRAYVTATAPEAGRLDAVGAVAGSPLEPSAVEIDVPDPGGPATVTVLIEGVAAGERAEAAGDLLGAVVPPSATPPAWWGSPPDGGYLLELRVPPASAGHAIGVVAEAAGPLAVHVRGSAACAVLWLGLDAAAPAGAVGAFVSRVRAALGTRGGRLVVWDTPATGPLDRWGPVGAAALMRRVKERFDPEDRMAPGRTPGAGKAG